MFSVLFCAYSQTFLHLLCSSFYADLNLSSHDHASVPNDSDSSDAPASVAPSPVPKANNSRKAVVSGMTGYELLKRVKESVALRDILVVIMSSENVPTCIIPLPGGIRPAPRRNLGPIRRYEIN